MQRPTSSPVARRSKVGIWVNRLTCNKGTRERRCIKHRSVQARHGHITGNKTCHPLSRICRSAPALRRPGAPA